VSTAWSGTRGMPPFGSGGSSGNSGYSGNPTADGDSSPQGCELRNLRLPLPSGTVGDSRTVTLVLRSCGNSHRLHKIVISVGARLSIRGEISKPLGELCCPALDTK
jgi:hypothetical protein